MKKKVAGAGAGIKSAIQVNDGEIKAHLGELVRQSVGMLAWPSAVNVAWIPGSPRLTQPGVRLAKFRDVASARR